MFEMMGNRVLSFGIVVFYFRLSKIDDFFVFMECNLFHLSKININFLFPLNQDDSHVCTIIIR